MKRDKVFFSGLNELRAIAAIAVIFHHVELYRQKNNTPSLFDTMFNHFIGKLGENGVHLFFVLSGFLITYLLLVEIEDNSRINIRSFYLRRILRIWPLYYFLLAVSFFLLPYLVAHCPVFQQGAFVENVHGLSDLFGVKLALFLLFLPNVVLILFDPIAGVSQSWSVGVEEQFYIIWPQLMQRFRNKIPTLLCSIIVAKFALFIILRAIDKFFSIPHLLDVRIFLSNFNIELMALGGLGACLLYQGKLDFFYKFMNRGWSLLLTLILITGLLFGINYLLISVLFLVLILCNINDKTNVVRSKPLAFLGKISYGLYMYHPLVMFLSYSFLRWGQFFPVTSFAFNTILYIMVIGLTIGIAFLSYTYFEMPFLRIKKKFTVVNSGNNG